MSRSRDVDGTIPRSSTDPIVLRRTIERALKRDDAPAEVLPMLERLQRIALEGSEERSYADRRLAEMLLETAPWRAALHIRRLVETEPHEDATWALMGLAQALLGHYRYACKSYRRALAISPNNPWYSHNLGHLLDVALDRPDDARKHLERAHVRVPDEPAITCSLVHALWRGGHLDEARRVLRPLLVHSNGTDPDVTALAAELDREATEGRSERNAFGKPTRPTPTPLGGPRAKKRHAEPPAIDRTLVARAARPLSLSPSRRAGALRLLADYTRSASSAPEKGARRDPAKRSSAREDDVERALLAGAAVLAIARVDRLVALPYQAMANLLGVPTARLRARARAVIAALAVVVDDPRYRAGTRG